LSGGELTDCEKGSTSASFTPGVGDASEEPLVADCGTAGACSLLVQSILPVLALGLSHRRTVSCVGGTDVNFSPAGAIGTRLAACERGSPERSQMEAAWGLRFSSPSFN
jgi:RNA 3'-terminal phosphate cyclase